MIKRSNWLLAVIVVFAWLSSGAVYAEDVVKPFILASTSSGGDVASVAADTKKKLTAAGFEVVGSYSPYDGVEIIVFTNDELKSQPPNQYEAVTVQLCVLPSPRLVTILKFRTQTRNTGRMPTAWQATWMVFQPS